MRNNTRHTGRKMRIVFGEAHRGSPFCGSEKCIYIFQCLRNLESRIFDHSAVGNDVKSNVLLSNSRGHLFYSTLAKDFGSVEHFHGLPACARQKFPLLSTQL